MNTPKGEETIFAEALRLPPEERADYLAQATAGNPQLRQEIESLLANYGAGDFLEAPPASDFRPTINVSIPLTEKPGDRIGRYKLLEQIGEGGCGVVYVAEQTEPVRRRVALKIIKLGMDTKSVVARFEAERQALAMMDHPNIAKVFDAGATETGRPYFVMELVRGLKITDYCDAQKLSTNARLDLFIHVCQAIQHAHQKGIIHRDIKPSNILVTVNDGVAVPKVIDFGIAKATNGQLLTDKTIYTAFQQFIGTPAYMSPEQAVLTSLDIDTRSDIYALGVLLYELLTGKTPFDAKELLAIGLDEMRRTIREQEPPKPSTRVSTLPGDEQGTTAQRRGIEAPKLVSELRGDLDWIVMKALEKDRARRYETANGLAMDIQRHLSNEPVVACPPSRLYRFQKTVRRNKLAFIAAAAVVSALVIGLGVATWMFIRERAAVRERSRLLQEARTAQANEERQRRTAEAEEFKARQNLYAADMNLAHQGLERGNLGQVRQLVAKYWGQHNPDTGRKDPRGWEWRNLWQRSRGDEATILTGHSNIVSFAGMLPDGRTIVSVSQDRTLRFWDLRTRQLLETVSYPDEPWCGALSPDGRWLAVGGEQGRWSLWDTASRELRLSRTNSSRVRGLAFSLDNARVAVASANGLEVWTLQDFRRIAELARQNVDFKMGLAFSPDGKTLAYSQSDFIVTTNALMLWNLETGKTTNLGILPVGGALDLAFTTDGRLICAERTGISVWDLSGRRVLKRLTGHDGHGASSVALSPDRKLMASASAGGGQTVRLWHTESWEETRVFQGLEFGVSHVAFASDGKRLLSCGAEEVRVWDVEAKSNRRETYTPPPGWRLMPNMPETTRQLRIQVGTGGKTEIGFLELARVEEEDTRPSPIPLAANEIPDTVSGNLTKLAILRTNGVIEVWGLMPFAKLKVFSSTGARRIALGNTGRWLAIEREDRYIEIWDLMKERSSVTLDPLPKYVAGSSFFYPDFSFWAADTRFVRVTRQADELAESVDVVLLPGKERQRIKMTHKNTLNNFSLSSDGKLLSTSAWDGQIKIWDVMSGKEIHTFPRQLISFISSAFSPDGTRFAAGGYDGRVTLWDLSSFNQVAQWKAHANYSVRVCFLENGNTLMTKGSPNTYFGNWETHIWRPPSFAEIQAAETATAYRPQTK